MVSMLLFQAVQQHTLSLLAYRLISGAPPRSRSPPSLDADLLPAIGNHRSKEIGGSATPRQTLSAVRFHTPTVRRADHHDGTDVWLGLPNCFDRAI